MIVLYMMDDDVIGVRGSIRGEIFVTAGSQKEEDSYWEENGVVITGCK